MRVRRSSRLLVLDAQGRLLLFRFRFRTGETFWATPGGELEPGESFEAAAVRELREETGLVVERLEPAVATRAPIFETANGERVQGDEQFFLLRVGELSLSVDGWTDLEREIMVEHRWWTRAELAATTEQIWPADIASLLPRGAPQR